MIVITINDITGIDFIYVNYFIKLERGYNSHSYFQRVCILLIPIE